MVQACLSALIPTPCFSASHATDGAAVCVIVCAVVCVQSVLQCVFLQRMPLVLVVLQCVLQCGAQSKKKQDTALFRMARE